MTRHRETLLSEEGWPGRPGHLRREVLYASDQNFTPRGNRLPNKRT